MKISTLVDKLYKFAQDDPEQDNPEEEEEEDVSLVTSILTAPPEDTIVESIMRTRGTIPKIYNRKYQQRKLT